MKINDTYASFKKRVTDNLARFNTKWGVGTFNGKGQYQYIAKVDDENRLEVIWDIIETDGVERDLYQKPHRYAHHLNSSQVMCYEFFRPLMTPVPEHKWGLADSRLVEFVQERIGVSIKKGAICRFEYEDEETNSLFKSFTDGEGKGEKSQFDFYIRDGEIEIFFEIKYTEPSFGKWPSDRSRNSPQSVLNHCTYIEKGYKDMLLRNPFFTQQCKERILSYKEQDFSNPDNPFNKQYQLFRNTIKTGTSKYSVFIFPRANPNTKREFELFVRNLLPGQCHIIGLNWEDLHSPSYMSQRFYDKFIDSL